MILFGVFLDCIFLKILSGSYLYPCFSLVFSCFSYLKEKEFDSFLLSTGIQCFFAFLLFKQNFFLNYSYFILFYVTLYNFFSKRFTKKDILFCTFFLLVGYYIYGGILYFLLQRPILFSKWCYMLVSSLLFNLIVTFLISLFFGLTRKRG